jgi:hypothetical protein
MPLLVLRAIVRALWDLLEMAVSQVIEKLMRFAIAE